MYVGALYSIDCIETVPVILGIILDCLHAVKTQQDSAQWLTTNL